MDCHAVFKPVSGVSFRPKILTWRLCCASLPALQAVHNQWSNPTQFQPERFMPGGEYDQFDEVVRPYMFLPFIQVRNW
jgi:hypothetical protein